jgi:hypothetical protein
MKYILISTMFLLNNEFLSLITLVVLGFMFMGEIMKARLNK